MMLSALAFAAALSAADPAPVVAAELAFAARAAEVGVARSFLDFMTDDAIVLAPDPTSAKAVYGARPPGKTPKEGGTLLGWWPVFAGVSRAGDLGFTTGPAEVNGKRSVRYFTVWQRQADGGWKWVYDGGAPSDPTNAQGPGGPVQALPASTGRTLAPDAARREVGAVEARLAQRAETDLPAAYAPVLAPDARVQGSPRPPAATPAQVAQELATRPKAARFSPLGGGAAQSGDLVWTYGGVRWDGGRGHYVRVWQSRRDGWKLVFDQVLTVDAPKS